MLVHVTNQALTDCRELRISGTWRMGPCSTYIVRPLSKASRTDFKDLFKVYLSPATLIFHEFRAGDLCALGPNVGPAIVWPASEKIQDSVIQTSKTLQNLYGLKLGDKVSISRNEVPIKDARIIHLREVLQQGSARQTPNLNAEGKSHWAWFLEYTLQMAEIICPGLPFDNIEIRGEKRSFVVVNIDRSNDHSLFRVQSHTRVHISDLTLADADTSGAVLNDLKVLGNEFGGLDKQLKQLNDRLAAYNEEESNFRFPPYYRPRRGGVILYGPSGTGKSMMLQKLSNAGWHKVFQINALDTSYRRADLVAVIRDTFVEAHRHQPSLIVLDNIELIAGNRNSAHAETFFNVAPILCGELDRLGPTRIFVVAATTLLSGLDETLRGAGRFEFEIEIPVPNLKARIEILKVLCAKKKDAEDKILESLADRTHGFVGADLDRLIQLAVDKAKVRLVYDRSNKILAPTDAGIESCQKIDVEVEAVDFNEALLEVRPTAMREVFLETPKVKWSDIGGQHETKKILAQAIEWPFKYPMELGRLGIEPKKGLLLYGPPGCSKTLTAKAVATESGLNFIAIKGGELLSMYVGESERALREIFRKARAASPSILFFDEIDAIGESREACTKNGGINVLTTLLNELDGIELLQGVFVLAATNKPEVLDPALMRPGRLDTALYVGLPNVEARREMLQIKLRMMDTAEDVDVEDLASWTGGYSGAEIMSVCQKAGYAALEEQISSRIRQRISGRHFEIALLQVPRQITSDMILSYQMWGEKSLTH